MTQEELLDLLAYNTPDDLAVDRKGRLVGEDADGDVMRYRPGRS